MCHNVGANVKFMHENYMKHVPTNLMQLALEQVIPCRKKQFQHKLSLSTFTKEAPYGLHFTEFTTSEKNVGNATL